MLLFVYVSLLLVCGNIWKFGSMLAREPLELHRGGRGDSRSLGDEGRREGGSVERAPKACLHQHCSVLGNGFRLGADQGPW